MAGEIKLGDTFEISQEYIDWYNSIKWGVEIGVLPSVGTVCRVQGFHEWKGEITIRAELPGGGILAIPDRFVSVMTD